MDITFTINGQPVDFGEAHESTVEMDFETGEVTVTPKLPLKSGKSILINETKGTEIDCDIVVEDDNVVISFPIEAAEDGDVLHLK